MRVPLAFALLLSLAGGVVGGLLIDAFRGDRAPELATPRDTSGLETRVAGLEDSFVRLADEIHTRAPDPVVAPRAAADPKGVEPAPVDAAEASPTDDRLADKVREIVEDQNRAERAARAKRMEEMAAQRQKEFIDRVAGDLQLTPYQKDELAKILSARRQKMQELFGSDGTRPTREQMRDAMEKARKETDDQLRSLLSTAQYESITKTLSADRGPGGFGGRPGGGRNRPGANAAGR